MSASKIRTWPALSIALYNGKFYANAKIFGVRSGNSATITGFDQFKYSTTTLKPYYLIFIKIEFGRFDFRIFSTQISIKLTTSST